MVLIYVYKYKYHPNVTEKYIMSTTTSKKATPSIAEKKMQKKISKGWRDCDEVVADERAQEARELKQ